MQLRTSVHFLVVGLLFSVGACAPSRTVRKASTHIGQRLELVAVDLTGQEQDVGREQGTVRVIDFWASWCEPCREAMPQLDELATELGPRGLSVYAVAFDEDREQVSTFLKQTPVRFPVLWDKGGDRYSSRYEVARLPTTLIVDRKGVIRAVKDGWGPSKARETRREVEKLLDESP